MFLSYFGQMTKMSHWNKNPDTF